MKNIITSHSGQKKSTLLIFLFSLIMAPLSAQIKNCDTIFPNTFIQPFLIENLDPVNVPLINPEPAGDINGDGKDDFIFGAYAADERTFMASDNIYKSIITLETGNNPNAVVMYGKHLKGLGDYNGDGFDDVYDIENNVIYFGYAGGISDVTLSLEFSPDYNEFVFPGDLNNDGMAEIIIGKGSGSINSMLIFSGMDTVPIIFFSSGTFFPVVDRMRFFGSDYDADGESETCIIYTDLYMEQFITRWYYMDKENHQMILEYSANFDFYHDPSPHYTTTLSDVNGDGFIDLTHAYYDGDTLPKFDIAVNLGIGEDPYFSESDSIDVDNPNRLLYHAGDFNGDGADDWYSIAHEDSIVLYYGGPDVLTDGFTRMSYFTGDNQMIYPKSRDYQNMDLTSHNTSLLFYNNDNVADLFFYYWSFDENLQYDFFGTAVVTGGNDPDFINPLMVGRSGNDSYRPLEYGYLSKNIGDFNNDGFDDWGALAKSGCYLDVFYGGESIDYTPDVKYLLPQTKFAISFDWSAGDLNGDGWLDIAISNSSVSEVAHMKDIMTARNAIFIFYGKPEFQTVYNYEDADVVLFDNDNTFLEFGENLGIVGDYNADGYDDLVVGGRKNNACLREAFVYFGGEQINTNPDMIIQEPGYQ